MDNLFFLLSKIFWLLARPDALLLYLLALTLLLMYRNQWRWARRLLLTVTAMLTTLAILPIGSWMMAPLERQFPANPPLPERVDGIIVLGGFLNGALSRQWQQAELNDAAERGVAFAALAQRYPQARLVMSGGSALLVPGAREADYAALLLADLQIAPERALFERDSRNTIENVANSKMLAKPQPGENWLLITSATHMPRAVGVFCRQQWPVLAWPVDHRWSPEANRPGFDLIGNWRVLNEALHEWLGLLAYHVAGKTDALLPSACASSP